MQQDDAGDDDPVAAHVEDEELQMALALSQSVDEASAAQALREQESVAAAERQSLGPAGSSSKAEAVSYSLWSRDWCARSLRWTCPHQHRLRAAACRLR